MRKLAQSYSITGENQNEKLVLHKANASYSEDNVLMIMLGKAQRAWCMV